MLQDTNTMCHNHNLIIQDTQEDTNYESAVPPAIKAIKERVD